MKENELARCIELIVEIVDQLKNLQLSSEHQKLSATIQDLDMKIKELCSEQRNYYFMIDNCYR